MKTHRWFRILGLPSLAACGEAARDASSPSAPPAAIESALLPTFVIRGEPTRVKCDV